VPTASEDINLLNAKIRHQLLEEGNFYIVQTQLNGQLYLRVTLMNPLTTRKDGEDLLQRVEAIGNNLSALKIPEGNLCL
jgi:L-2,4-diaminobutyrate decarboxylase